MRQDLGAALVARDAEGRGIEDVVGARPIEFGLARAAGSSRRSAIRRSRPCSSRPSTASACTRCDSAVTGSDSPPGDGPDTLEIDCDMSGGSSGGGWVNADGALNGLTSYGYAGDFGHLYGPYFGAEAAGLYERGLGPRAALRRARGDQPRRRRGRRLHRRPRAPTPSASAARDDAAAGSGGDDRACGGGGGQARGGDGADRLRGGGGGDLLVGGPGEDTCIGGPGRDRARGCERRRRIP